MGNNVLTNINSILAAMGSKPYKLTSLRLDDLASLTEYSLGIKNLVDNLVRDKSRHGEYFYINTKIRSNNFLYRASSDKNMDYFIFTPGKRISEGTTNVYNLLISDILPSWKGIPKRNSSVICANSYDVAEEYIEYGSRNEGVVYVVIPPNNAIMVVSPNKDIWYAFDRVKTEVGLEGLDSFNDSMLVFLAFFYKFITDDKLLVEITDPSYNTFELLKNILREEFSIINTLKIMFAKRGKPTIMKMFNKIDQILSDTKTRDIILPLYAKYADENPLSNVGDYIIHQKSTKSNVTIVNILDRLFDPEENGFAITRYSIFLNETYPKCEVWTDQPCLFIDSNDSRSLTALKKRFS